jgi:hypothetical protein
MWTVRLLLVFVSMALVIVQAVLLVRDRRPASMTHLRDRSSGLSGLLKALRLYAGVGAVMVWSALIYVLIDTGGWDTLQSWQAKPQGWAIVYPFLYTAFCLDLMRTSNWVAGPSAWRPSYRLGLQAFIISASLLAALASIADLYYPPPWGSRVGELASSAHMIAQ